MKTLGDFRDKLTVGTVFRLHLKAWGWGTSSLLQVHRVEDRGIVCNAACVRPALILSCGKVLRAPGEIGNLGHYNLYEWNSTPIYLRFGSDPHNADDNLCEKSVGCPADLA